VTPATPTAHQQPALTHTKRNDLLLLSFLPSAAQAAEGRQAAQQAQAVLASLRVDYVQRLLDLPGYWMLCAGERLEVAEFVSY
jgi:hypothetical protein